MFDNVNSTEANEHGEHLPNYLDREHNRRHLQRMNETNVVTGNRSNLLFVQSALEHIRQNEERQQRLLSDSERAVSLLENAILGIQVGHYAATKNTIGAADLRGQLWSLFRSTST